MNHKLIYPLVAATAFAAGVYSTLLIVKPIERDDNVPPPPVMIHDTRQGSESVEPSPEVSAEPDATEGGPERSASKAALDFERRRRDADQQLKSNPESDIELVFHPRPETEYDRRLRQFREAESMPGSPSAEGRGFDAERALFRHSMGQALRPGNGP